MQRRGTTRPSEPAQRLLVLRALGLGDLLTAVPALRALRDAHRLHRITLAAPKALEPLARLSGAVDEVVDAAALAPLPEGAAGADVAVNLHGRGPESHRILAEARPGRLIAFRHRAVPETRHAPEWNAGEHEVRRWCRRLAESGVPSDPGRLELEPPARPAPEAARGATLVHPGAASGSRRWPAERFAAVVRSELAAARRVAITGSPAEVALGRSVAEGAGLSGAAVLAGRTDLTDLVAAVAAASRVVCGDTGVAHLATALGTPSVVLFGPTSPAEWGPLPDPRHRVLWAGGTGDPHASGPDPGLLEIGVGDVLGELERLGEARAAA